MAPMGVTELPRLISGHPPTPFSPSERLLAQMEAERHVRGQGDNKATSPIFTLPIVWWLLPLLSVLAFILLVGCMWWAVHGVRGVLSAVGAAITGLTGLRLPPPPELDGCHSPEDQVLVDR